MKKKYNTPRAEKLVFDYTKAVVSSDGGNGGNNSQSGGGIDNSNPAGLCKKGDTGYPCRGYAGG